MSTDRSPTARTYRISPIRQAILPAIFLAIICVLLIGALLDKDPAERFALCLTAGILFLIGLPMFWLVRYTRLTISPDGVEVRQFGWTVSAPWDNVASLCLDPGAQGLELRRPMTNWGAKILAGGNAMVSAMLQFYPPEHKKLVDEHRWIPLEPFAWWFRHGQLRQDLARHAPWLFGEKQQG
jgi:hypothetical protein